MFVWLVPLMDVLTTVQRCGLYNGWQVLTSWCMSLAKLFLFPTSQRVWVQLRIDTTTLLNFTS